jgi:hypothetical protein
MDRPKLEVADVLRPYGEAYRQQHGASLSTAQRRVMTAIEVCGTAAVGGLHQVFLLRGGLVATSDAAVQLVRWYWEKAQTLTMLVELYQSGDYFWARLSRRCENKAF